MVWTIPARTRRLAMIVGLALATVTSGTVGQSAPAPAVEGVVTLTGSVAVSNPLVVQVLSEPYILLADLANFVVRDVDGDPPDDPQVLARLEGDLSDASYAMPLPILPQGRVSDVDHGGPGAGVQVYSVEFAANIVGDPFYGPLDAETGWGTAFSSMRVENGTYEVVGGRVVAWAGDADQRFPSGFGADDRLFTADDPLASLEPGWTVVDLDQRPFAFERQSTVEVPILEGDGGLKDLSDLGYTAAFDALLDELRRRYPFTETKGLDLDAIGAEIRPLVEEAERDGDQSAFNAAIARFAVLFGDGHVSASPPIDDLLRRYGGTTGLALGRTDAGEVIVRVVADASPAADAGIVVGASLIEWDGRPVAEVVADQELVFSASSPHVAELQRLALLPRGAAGARVNVRYRNPDADPAEAALDLVPDERGLFDAFGPAPTNPAELPVTVDLLDGRVGYVRLNTFFDDLALVAASWEWAITRLVRLDAAALIVDVRGNGGGAGTLATYAAGAFTDDPFVLAESSFADQTGTLVPSGSVRVDPTPVRWDRPVAVLIDERCASACELFVAAVAEDPDHLVVGQYPTAGVEGAVYPWNLPGDLYFQAPLGLFRRDGAVFIESTGVPPTVDVPVSRDSLLGDDDVVLDAALAALRPAARQNRANRRAAAVAPDLDRSPVTVPTT